MNWDVFITCAETGSGDTTGKSDKVPVTPQQIADSALDAANAGAAVVHIHMRDSRTGKGVRDVDPQARQKIGEVMANARRADAKLTLAPLPHEGKITFVATSELVVTDVDFVQESAPEKVKLKQELFASASRAAKPDTVFGSSTSGI